MKRIPFFFLIGTLSVLLVAGFTSYFYFARASYKEDVKKLDTQVAILEKEALKYGEKSLESALKAKEALAVVKSDYIKWSSVIENVLSTTPKDKKTKNPLVEYTSYSGAQGSSVSISAQTVSGSQNPFEDVAKLIKAFDDSSDFSDSFVPSISTSFAEDGSMILVFNFNVKFNPSK